MHSNDWFSFVSMGLLTVNHVICINNFYLNDMSFLSTVNIVRFDNMLHSSSQVLVFFGKFLFLFINL